MKHKYTFTVFTPTYNRAHTLRCVFDSLQQQTYNDFEWLIVDDGSTDNTADIIETWKSEARFPIHYIIQNNGGKHRAINKGIAAAKGELFLILDSDDRCIPEALERFHYHWNTIPHELRDQFSAITALCMDKNGEIVGDKFPEDVFDSNSILTQDKYGIKGEKWGFQRTDILKEYPFPEYDDEKFITENIVWDKISLKYKTRFINEKLRIYEILNDGLSASSIKLRAKNTNGTTSYYNNYLTLPVSLKGKCKAAINYVRFSAHGGRTITNLLGSANNKLLVVLSLPFGFLYYLNDLSVLSKNK